MQHTLDKEDVEGLQDLIVAALRDAYKKVEEPKLPNNIPFFN